MSSTVAVRFASGVVGETQRQAHLAAAPTADALPVSWTTFCGRHIPAEVAEVSHVPAGMPCMACMMRSAALGDIAVGSGEL